MKEIILFRGQVTQVDDEDYEWLAAHRWYKRSNGYAATKVKSATVYMHRLIMDAPKGVEVDHADGDRLNNQRSNLRFASRIQNARNMRKRAGHHFKGVTKIKSRWVAQIMHERCQYFLGTYGTKEVAAVAYDLEAIRRFGDFACTNYTREELPALEKKHWEELHSVKRRRNCSSRFKGVTLNKSRGKKWHAQLGRAGKHYHIGQYDTEEEAARAYDAFAREFLGDKAKCNFPTPS